MHEPQSTGLSLQDALTAVVQDLQSPTAKDKKKSVDGLVSLLSEVVERGTCPMEALGQHVCCNIMALIIQHYVTPTLMKQRSSLSARTDVTKPFYQLLELLHKHVPPTFKHQPFLWKNAKPLHMLMKHVAEVLEGTGTGVHCCQDYAAMVVMLMRIEVYRTSVTRRVVYEITLRLLQLAKDGIHGGATPLSEAALEQVACAISALASCPHFVSALTNNPVDVMRRLLEVTMRRHEQTTISSPLKVEMHLITAIRRLAEGTQHDHKQCAQLPWKLVKVVLSTWHMATRRDGWRLEAVQFVTHQLAVVFSELTHHATSASIHQRRRATDREWASPDAAAVASHQRLEDVGSSFAHGASCPATLVSCVDELHASILPAVLSILSAPKCEFSIVSSRELSHAPCLPLQALFDFAAFVLFLAQRTYVWAAGTAAVEEEVVGHNALPSGEREKKRHRAAASPLMDIVGHLTTLAKDPAANTFRRDVSCVWLHTLSVPVVAMWMTADDASLVVEALMLFCPLGGAVEQPLLAALANVAPHANLPQRLGVYQWAQSKYIPCTGVDVDDGVPSPLAYELLTRVLEGILAGVMAAFCYHRGGGSTSGAALFDAAGAAGAGVGGAQPPPDHYGSLVPTTAQSRAYHFSSAAAAKEDLCLPMLRYTIRLAQLGFFAGLAVPEPFESAAILSRILTFLSHHDVHQKQELLTHTTTQTVSASQRGDPVWEVTARLTDVAQLDAAHRLLAAQRQGTAPAATEERLSLGAKLLAEGLVREMEAHMVRLPAVVATACLPDAVLHQPFHTTNDHCNRTPATLGLSSGQREALQPFWSAAPAATEDEASPSVQHLANVVAALTLGIVTQQQNSAAAQPTSDTATSASGAAALASLGGRALQLAHAILHLRGLRVWSCPSSDADGSRLAELVTRGGHADATAASMATITAQLSAQGVVLYSMQCLLDVAATRMARCTSIVDEVHTLPALQHLLEHTGKDLFSVDVSLWEPSQRILSCMGLIGRKLLEGIPALASKQGALAGAAAEGTSGQCAMALGRICKALRWFYVTLRTTDICLASTDPLINVHHAISAVLPVLRGPLLRLVDAPNDAAPGGSQPQPNVHMVLLESAFGLLSVLVVLNNEDAHGAVLDALRTLFSRHPHSHSEDVFGVLTLFGEDACPPWSVATRHQLGALCELVVTTLRRNDQDMDNLLSPTPPLQLALHISMVHCIAHVLGRCESAQAERLAKLFFQFSGATSTFSVRLATAKLIAVPFRVFSRVGSVLQELQFHAKDAIMSAERSTAATALLALSNACRSAPQLEADVISFMLEFYSTRDFHHRPLIVQALQRIASGAQPYSTAAQADATALVGSSSALSSFAALTRHHAHRLLYDWLWRFGHPMEALPIRCFGYDTLQEMAANFVAVMLPVALLHMQQQDSSGGGTRHATASALNHPAVALFHMFSPSGDTTGLLRDNFAETVASLLLFQESKHSTPCTKAHLELADAAAYALEWVTLQLGRELFRDLCKRHADLIVTLVVQRCGKGSGACLVADGDGTGAGVAVNTMVFALPGVSFAVGSKALASLCSLVDAGTIRQFFAAFQGDRAFYLLSHMYLDCMSAPSAVATCDALIALQQVVSGWLTPCLTVPHVLESALHIVCNLFNGGAVVLPSASARGLVCDLIKHIWTTVLAAPHADKLLRPHAPLVSSTLLSLKQQFVEVGRLWTDLSAADARLRRADWHHQQSQFATTFSQEQQPYDVDEGKDNDARGQDKTTVQQQATILRVLEDVDLLAGTPTANFYRDLGDALDREVDTVVAAVHHDPKRGCSAMRLAAQHLLQVATSTAADAVPLDTRIAALAALRALYVALLEAKRLLPAATLSAFGSHEEEGNNSIGGTTMLPLLTPSMVLQLHGKPQLTLSVDQAFLSGIPHDTILDKMYAFVLQHLRDLCHHRHPALVLEAATAVRGALASQHEVMTRVKAYVEKEDKALFALLQPLQRDVPIPAMKRQHASASIGPHPAASLSSHDPLSASHLRGDANSSVPRMVAPLLEGSVAALAQASPGGLPPPLQGGVLAAPVLWNLLPHQPDVFLCYFVRAFAEYYQLDTKLGFLQSILPVVQMHTPTAAALLPVMFLHAIMLNETESQRRARRAWSECIRTGILQRAASLPTLTRAFLSAIDTVRCALTSVLKVSGRQRKRATASSHHPHIHVKTAAGSVPVVENVTDVWWLSDITAMDLALAAAACEQWNTSAFYLEMSCESLLGKPGLVPLTLAVTAQASLIPVASEGRRVSRDVTRQAEVAVHVQKHREALLSTSMAVGKAFGDRDWIDACSRHATLTAPLSAVRCEVMGDWQQALQHYDATMRQAAPSSSANLARCLMHLGCPNTAAAWMLATARSSVASDPTLPIAADVRSALAEAAWRTSQWDTVLPTAAAVASSRPSASAVSLQECIFMALKALYAKDTLGYRVAMRAGQGQLLGKLSGHTSVLDAMVYSQLFHDVASCSSTRSVTTASGSSRVRGASIFGNAAQYDALFCDEAIAYDRVEVLDWCRTVLCRLRGDVHAWSRHVTAAAERALDGSMVTVASQQVQQFVDAVQGSASSSSANGAGGAEDRPLHHLAKLPSVALSRARVLMAQGDASLAIRTLQGVETTTGRDAAMHANIVRCVVQWAHEAQIVPTESLLQDAGFHSILKVREPGGRSSYLMASLCDVVLRELQTRWEGPEAQRVRQSIKESSRTHDELKRQADTLKRQIASGIDAAEQQRNKEMIAVLRHRMDHLTKDIEQYNTQQDKLMHDWTLFRNTALHHYAKALAEGGDAGAMAKGGTEGSCGSRGVGGNRALHSIFRLVDLWLTPPANVTVSEEQDRPSIMSVPTHCYLHLFTQLAARLTPASSPILRDVVLTVAADYPHQTLWTLSALANGNRWTAAERTTHSSDTEKIALARSLLDELKERPALAPIVKGVEQLAEAFMELAFEKPPKEHVTVPIKPQSRLMQSKRFQLVPVPTVFLPPDATSAARSYKLGSEVLTVLEYRAYYEKAGGINVPKILYCITSSGRVEKQLLKSNDDMRQDAIIEQVFGMVNALLQHDTATRHRRHLSIRRYQVVPLGPSTGILQWVNQTMPLGHYLVGNGDADMPGAHARYFPDEPTLHECRERLDHKRVQGADRTMAYRDIASRFTPAMHYFFLEYFATPEVWLQKKHAYANSVAAASMVGYLVGLGDRHLSNLLVHTHTAEIVMIDLGIAFEQGKLLRMPELVPFRLTRDMVDGLGMHGVEGHFRSACEATLRCTREHKALLGTILDAFIHDPLAKWAVDTTDAIAAGSVVTSTSVAGSKDAALPKATRTTKSRQSTADADRAVARVREKLNGYEGGEVFSVSGQVQRLIQTATSEECLAQMFEGWSAWV